MKMHALQRLNLTDAQKQQLRANHERFAASLKPQREELRQLFEQYRQNGSLSAEQQARVRTLRNGMVAPGEYSQFWDGMSESSERVPAGLYFVTLAPSQGRSTQRSGCARSIQK